MSSQSTEPPSTNPLAAHLRTLPGATPAKVELLARLGLRTVGDLLFHFPRSYEDLTDVRPIAALRPACFRPRRARSSKSRAAISGTAVAWSAWSSATTARTCLEGVWFNQPYAAGRFRYGQRLSFSGKPKWYRDHWQMSSPRVQILDGEAGPAPGVVPVYPLTDDLRREHLRPLIGRALDLHAGRVVETLPEGLRGLHDWPGVREALRTVHFPTSPEEAVRARRRFIYEEFLLLQLALALRRREVRDRGRAPVLPSSPVIDARIRRLFPFALTADQDRAVADLCRDLACERPMQRLLQADVGAGKTAVAVYALLVAVANKHQAALMAPTEVLARQHFRTLERYLAHSRVRRLLLTGGRPAANAARRWKALRTGEIDLVVGTQALVQEDVQFARLGLVVIDEQHKFGVHQRARFRKLGVDPHYLVMTATPIPRTVALTVFGDLDVSVMRQLPPGRKPVLTRWQPADQRERSVRAVARGAGGGAAGVCRLPAGGGVGGAGREGGDGDARGVAGGAVPRLPSGPAARPAGRGDEGRRDGAVPGRRDRSCWSVRRWWKSASTCRTRRCWWWSTRSGSACRSCTSCAAGSAAGRWAANVTCSRNRPTRRGESVCGRLCGLRDGFALAEEDLRLRGVGEFFGARQHGLGELRFGDLIADADLLSLARRDAMRW